MIKSLSNSFSWFWNFYIKFLSINSISCLNFTYLLWLSERYGITFWFRCKSSWELKDHNVEPLTPPIPCGTMVPIETSIPRWFWKDRRGSEESWFSFGVFRGFGESHPTCPATSSVDSIWRPFSLRISWTYQNKPYT